MIFLCMRVHVAFAAERIPGQAQLAREGPVLRCASPREGADSMKGSPATARTDARGWRAACAEIQPGGPALALRYRCCLVLLGLGRWERKGRNREEREGRDSAEDARRRSVGR